MRAQRNYAGHRLAPWLSHVMVSRQETARPLLTPGEVMQLPPADELVLVSGLAPIRAKKLRYYEDRNFLSRIADAPLLGHGDYADKPVPRANDWSGQVRGVDVRLAAALDKELGVIGEEGGIGHQRHPGLPEQPIVKSIAPKHDIDLGVEDESDAVADKSAIDRARGLGAVARAHAVNQGKSRGDDLLPSF